MSDIKRERNASRQMNQASEKERKDELCQRELVY